MLLTRNSGIDRNVDCIAPLLWDIERINVVGRYVVFIVHSCVVVAIQDCSDSIRDKHKEDFFRTQEGDLLLAV